MAFIPSLGGLAAMTVGLWSLHKPIDLVVFMAIMISLGLTLDYGIFCANLKKSSEKKCRKPTALFCCQRPHQFVVFFRSPSVSIQS